MKCVVLCINGILAPAAETRLRSTVAAANTVVGVDGGTRHLLRLGILPDFVTGDFDSLTAEELAALAARGVRIVPTPDQNYTDFDKALTFTLDELGAERVRVFGASGGRLDHIYSNLSALIKYGRRADIRLVDETGETWLIDGKTIITGADLPRRTLSLLAFGPADGVTTTGLRWPLQDESLAPGVRDGTLNEVTEETVTVRVQRGDLLILLHHNAARYSSDQIKEAVTNDT